MSQVEISEAAADLAGLVERARDGEEVVLAQGGRVVARLVAADAPSPARRLGLARGKWRIPEDFDAPLPEDVLALFYDGPIFPDEPRGQNSPDTQSV